METVTDFLSKLSSHGVKLSVDAGQLNCYAPKGTLTSDLKDGILKYKPELIALLESGAKKPAAAPQLSREFPLSAGQKGLYILHKLHPGMSAYNVPLCYRIESEVRVDLMARAWSLVLEQYPILTARIVEKDGSPYHLLDDACRTTLQCSTIETEDDHQLLAFLRRHAKAPFDLERGPLTRVDLFALPGGASILLLNIHHILFDGVSAVVLLRTLLGFYEQLCEGQSVAVSRDLPGYGRFVAWEESMLASPQGAAHAKYWQQQLDGELPVVELPPDWRRPAVATFDGRTLARDLPSDLVGRIRDFSRSHSALPSAVFLAAFQLLLHQYTGEDDVIVGMPVMGRASQEFANEIGYFINMIPLRAQCGERIRFIELLRKVQGNMLDGLYHSSYPFPLMVDGLKERQWDRNPVFQVSFAYQNYVKGGDFASLLRERSLKLEHVAGIYQEGDSDFGVEVFETEASSYSIHIQYNPALYSADTIEGVFERYCVLLRAIAEDPNRLLDEYLLLAPSEQHELLVELNETAAAFPVDRCIHELFAERAESAPDATAVVCGDRQITYGQLLETSRDLALYLQSQGIGPDALVGLCLERSPELVTGLLGILQAGGAYVPLDPSYPDDRLAYMLRDSNASIVLTQEKLRDRVASLAPAAKIVLLDRGWPKVEGAALRRDVRPHHLCYVIYTSGSTGQPKGVMVPHRGLVNHATYFANRLGLSPRDRVLQFASLSFDTAAEEMFPTWLSGAALVLRADGPPPTPADFFDFVRSAGVTILDLPTAYWHELADFVGHDDTRRVPSCVRAVILGGEAASGERFEKWRRVAGDTLLLNTYGPTEATIIATAYEPAESDAACVSLPIGRPIANARVYVLDEERKPVPAGIAGELYIGGAGVARGYLNRPELTAERFIADPFSAEAEARLYRTGDRVRRRRDGVIEFLGRADDQVKIRGFRIEPGEIETALRRHPSVRDAVVLVREDKPGDRRLIAFVVSQNGEPIPAAELRAALQASLPEFMIPAAFVPLEKIPMLPNGKLDRRALSRMDVTIESSQAYVAPRNETESRLVAIWSEVLNVAPERIGVNDSFFELGGHSLLATRVISKIRAELDVELPLKTLFERTSIAQLAERIATAQRRDIPAIVPVDRSRLERLPLSFAQERLWFIHQLEPDSAGYNVPGAVLLRGDVDVELLERAFRLIIERHENLRTVFPSEGGRARQVILDRVDFALERVDLTHLATREERDAEAKRLCQADAAAPFDLARGPLFRGQLIRLAADEHILMLNMHHIISDGWSLGVFVKEFGAILESLRQGREPELPALPIQYADYSVWQRNWLEESGVLDRQLAYWKQKLAGIPESLELPTDHARPGVQSFSGAARTFALDAELTAQLRRLAEQHGATLYMVLVAAVKALLHRYSGQTDICIGSPIANRQYAETEGLIGMFVNTLALRDQVEGEESFAALLAKVKATCLEAYEHQDAPFEKVVDAVRPQRNMAISPLFQVMVILQNAGTEALDPSLELYPLESAVSKFDLTVEFSETANGLAGAIEYSTALYRPRTIARMIEHLSALCRAIVARPAARVCDLELLGEAEKHRLLVEYNATHADYPKDGTLHQLFAAQAERHPEKTAVVCGVDQLTYGQLLSRSRELALYLQSEGVRPDSLVGICMERSLDMLVSMLGILEAGGAYVPLDPNYPDERLAYMLRDGRPAIVLTQAALEEKLRAVLPPATQLIAVDRQKGELAERVAALQAQGVELQREVGPHHLAYVIYTSGSTGQPKGVAIEHHSPVTLVHWAHEVYGPDELAGMLASTSICFDLSVYEIFVTLAAGGTIILVPNALALTDLPNRESVTLINTVPSAMEELVRLGAVPRSVRTINLAGEPLPARLVDKIYDTTSAEKVYDLYGPSEDTTYSTYVLRTKNGPQTIGRPIANTQVYILDRHGRLQPIGVPGELYIAGDGLARGYLNRPELTAEKFVDNPFTPGTRMYRTGDLARWNDDGTIQYLGRIDTQVKVRGFRIEIGEIEARLGQHPGVQDCTVIAQGEGASKQLVAFYRAAGTTSDAVIELPVEELRAALLRTLPEYMVPAAFVSLPAIPLTPNGKVDRRALARIDVTMTSTHAYVAPRNETERRLVAIWAEVLNAAPENIGVDDNFFELGGHSLLATQLISKIRTELGVDVPLKAIFERNTVAEFAELLATAKQNDIPAIVPVDRAQFERLPLSFAQERLWFIHQLEPESAGYNVPGAVRLEGELDVDLLDAAFNLLIERHETLRTIFPSEEGEAHQVILDRADFRLERVDVSHQETKEARERAAEEVCRLDAATPFDLARGPLVRGKAIRLGEREHVLMLNLHHIICDGWSLGVLFREIGAIVEALREGRRPELPPLPIQYADYSVWQRNRLEEGGVLARQLAYWQEKLAATPESLDLPTDHPRPSEPTFAGATHSFRLDAELTAQLRRFAEQRGGTLYMALLAGFKALFHRYSGQDDICIGSPIANRQYAETEGLIGMFVNTLALRTTVDGDAPFATLFENVKRTCLEAYEHQDAPFERVVDSLRLERNLTLTPLFQVMVALQNYESDSSVELYPLDSGITKFDLTVQLTETADGLAGSIQYRTALYRPETIERMARHFAALCRAAVATPAARVSELDYLDAAETRQLLVDFNDTRSEAREVSLQQLFAEAVAAHPDRAAVVCGESQLTFRELHDRSRDLAVYLRAHGVTADTRVGLCTGRSLEMVVGMLGILQAGGAYVPLDPDYPADRLQFMIEDAAPALVLTQERFKPQFSSAAVPLLALDSEWDVIASHAREAGEPLAVTPDALAYVIYTSGSTGTPKGVMVRRGGVVNLLHALEERVYAGRPDWTRVSVNASFAFDSSVKQFVQLFAGRTLVLVPQEVRLDADALVAFLAEERIDVFDCTPSQLMAMIGAGLLQREDLPKAFLIGGEAIDAALWRTLAERADVAFFNVYGPAECTVDATVARITADAPAPHIGAPIANVRVYILDRHQRPVPAGVVGEICIGGAGVARGYLNREELTAERFIANPFAEGRLYRTGDLGRWRADGTIAFAGRNDHQVKLRGQRIELGEIEAQLARYDGVREAVVIAREDEPGEKRLVAYLTTAGAAIAPEELRAHLAARLPQYMVPAAFVTLDTLPLTPNKKVDRKALPAPDALAYARKAYEPPQGAVEETLAAIWQELLHVERVGRRDNFFELGGHSLLATRVVSRIRAELNADLPLKALFERTSVAELAELIASARQNEIPPIVPVDRTKIERLPLSFAQERLWFIHQLEPDSAGYNIPGAMLLRGEVDAEQLERAFQLIIERHENLRTVFPSVDGRAEQRILDRFELRLERMEVSTHEEARRICEADAATPFDLAAGPLLRGKLIRLAADEHVLMLTMHHIVSDGWSRGVLVRELREIVSALRDGREPELPPLPIQYADYSVWQRNRLEEGGVLGEQLAYWQQKLAGIPESLELPTDHARPGVQSFAGATAELTLDPQLTAALKRLAEQQGATLYMVLVAAVKALLHRYSGQTDIVVGSPIANRQYAETEGLIGMFVNTLALRDQVEGEESFAALLAKVKTTCLEAYEHQDAPFEKVVDAVRPQRNMAVSPLFQVMVILQNVAAEALDPSIEIYPLENGISKFDLTFEFTETSEGLAGAIEYSTALYEPRTIARMVEHLTALCRAITDTPAAKIGALDYLSEAEKRTLLVDFNATHADYPKDGTLHQLFAAQAERHPEKTAVVCGGEQLTYGQLRTRSRDLALYLQSEGVRPDSLVGICMERSLDMLVSMLGILEAGGAYVPLDPNYPDERLAYMLRDGRPAIVLTQAVLEEKLRAVLPPATQLIAVDRQKGEVAERVAALQAQGVELQREVGPHHLAYVIYTSGSTGQPKGVAIEHHSPVTLVHWAHEVYGPDELAGMLASTSICFDLSVYEIFVTLAAGGTIILVPNALALTELPNRDSVTLINTVPSAMEELVRLGAVPRSVRTINLAGEPLPARLVDKIYDTTSAEKVYDLYGPSEDTTYSTYVLRTKKGPQTIGRPIANTQVYILDRHGRLQPIGMPGELYIAGDGLARGYLYRPELTAEKFVDNPFAPGTRMYRTGDLARWNDDGTIQYLGRIDTQVKVRGFRIEIGEIEARLGQHPGVQDCAVIAQGEGASKQLVAFYRAAGTTADAVVELPVEELRAALLRTLPEYMVPAAFVSLPAIPLTPNGKVDRRALARIDVTMTSTHAYVAPRNETERRLVAIWAEVLNAAPENIGVDDNFFELGGHSLLATRVVSRIRTELNADLPLKALFERSSVAGLAELIASAKQNEVPPIRPVDRAQLERLPLSFAQERLWFINQLEPESAGYNIPAAVVIRGQVDADRLERAFNRIIERHETLRTVFPSIDGRAEQRILDRLDFKLERLEASTHEEARRICHADAATPFDLAAGPLLRGKLIRLAADEHILMLTMHHIVSDGWSHAVLVGELREIVSALRDGREPELPPLPIQYADYSVWQRTWLEEGGVLEKQLAYWQQKLAGAPESLDLPTDYPRPSAPTFAGATHSFLVDAELTAQLKRFAEQRGGTLYMALLAGFKALFHRYSGQDDICIGSPIANRNYAETEGLIGMFVNTLALRTAVDGDAPFATLFENVKRTCLEAYEHQDAPFERVVDSLRLERNLTISPLFQVMVVLQNNESDSSIERYPLDSGITKFDLTVELTETAEGLAGSIRYRTALYRPETIERMAGHFVAMCRAAIATPAAKVGELDYLDAAETRRLLVDFNDTRVEVPEQTVDALFAEAVAAHPDRPAVVYGDRALTYRELYDRSRALAAYLRSRGVAPDSRVGLCTERSLEMVVGMLGIVQAGGAYVPLDPDYPADRLQFMLEDAAPALVLTQEHLKAKLPATPVPVVALDSEWDTIARERIEAPSGVSPDNLAYVIYTSGSTGVPKGVMVRHGGVVNLWQALERSIYAGHDDWTRVSVNASFAFDSSVKQFVQLLSGRTLVLVPQEVRLDADALLKFISDQRIDVFDCTPSQLVALVHAGLFEGAIPKAFLIGGEAIDTALWRTLSARIDAVFFNVYGPAECTVDATVARIAPDAPAPHIGRPIANVRIYILDRHGRPVPEGVVGEICIGGAGVARGYLNREELTAERFITDPFSSDPTARVYRTGDLGRWRPDGTIAFAGRNDHQVKLRGQRIELGEIEAQLAAHPAVKEAVVIAREDEPGERRLVAYVTTTGEDLGPEALRAHLAARLPQYMVPAAFVTLDALPLTPNRKVDREALPAPDALAYARKEYEAPQGAVEETLAAIWQELLHVERVGRHDDFFELGGHSLLAVQLMARIKKQFARMLPLATLFTAPTVASLANVLASGDAPSLGIVVPIQTGGDATPVFALPGAGGNVLALRPLAKALGADQPFYALQAVGLDGTTPPLTSVEDTARANIAALKAIQPRGPYRLLGHSYGGVVAYEMARLLLENGDDVSSLILLDSVAPSLVQESASGDEAVELFEACQALARLYGVDLQVDLQSLRRFVDSQDVQELVGLLNERGVEITAEQFAAFQAVYRANLRCYRTYTPPLLPRAVDASLYVATRAARDGRALPPDHGWSSLVPNPIRIHPIEADHFSILEHVRF